MLSPYYNETINTIKASWLELLCARLFGKRAIIKDGAYTVITARWRGKDYVLNFTYSTPQQKRRFSFFRR